MKHRRSIELTEGNKYVGPASELPWMNLAKLSQYYVLGGECGRCGHRGWIDREKVRRRFGADAFLKDLRNNLVCLDCGNRKSNVFTIWRA